MVYSKKGSVLDMLWIGIGITMFAASLLFGYKIYNEFNTQIQGNPDYVAGQNISTAVGSHYTGTMDNMFMFLTIALCIGSLILAALVRVHPIFIPIFIIVMILVIFFAGILSNIYTEMAETPNLSTEANALTKTSFIMTRLPLIIGIIGFVLMMVMYKLWSIDQ